MTFQIFKFKLCDQQHLNNTFKREKWCPQMLIIFFLYIINYKRLKQTAVSAWAACKEQVNVRPEFVCKKAFSEQSPLHESHDL